MCMVGSPLPQNFFGLNIYLFKVRIEQYYLEATAARAVAGCFSLV